MLKNLDIKNIIILGLFVLCVIGFTRFMLEGNGYKKSNKELEEKINEAERQKDSIQKIIDSIDDRISQDSIKIKKLESQNIDLSNKILLKDKEISVVNSRLINLKSDLEKTRREVEKLRNNPKNRTGQDLINSLREKIIRK